MSETASHGTGKSTSGIERRRAAGIANLRPWTPGQSGNPAGRPKTGDLEALCRAHTPAAVAALVKALASPRERVAAATALLDRGWGKPAIRVTGDKDAPLLVDFRWNDQPAAVIDQKVIEVVANATNVVSDETDVVWDDGGNDGQ